MKNNKFIKLISFVVIILMFAFSFVSCSSTNSADNQTNSSANEIKENNPKPNSVPEVNNRINPDLSKVEAPKASEAVTDTNSIEKFVAALESFANPNGNEFDALSILGEFRYEEKGDELLERLKTAAKSWHEPIVKNVGEKCIVKIKLDKSEKYKLTDTAVTEWNSVNGLEAEDYAKISCAISTNYAKEPITYIFDIVKLDGKWHISTIGTLNKIQSLITTDIYK